MIRLPDALAELQHFPDAPGGDKATAAPRRLPASVADYMSLQVARDAYVERNAQLRRVVLAQRDRILYLEEELSAARLEIVHVRELLTRHQELQELERLQRRRERVRHRQRSSSFSSTCSVDSFGSTTSTASTLSPPTSFGGVTSATATEFEGCSGADASRTPPSSSSSSHSSSSMSLLALATTPLSLTSLAYHGLAGGNERAAPRLRAFDSALFSTLRHRTAGRRSLDHLPRLPSTDRLVGIAEETEDLDGLSASRVIVQQPDDGSNNDDEPLDDANDERPETSSVLSGISALDRLVGPLVDAQVHDDTVSLDDVESVRVSISTRDGNDPNDREQAPDDDDPMLAPDDKFAQEPILDDDYNENENDDDDTAVVASTSSTETEVDENDAQGNNNEDEDWDSESDVGSESARSEVSELVVRTQPPTTADITKGDQETGDNDAISSHADNAEPLDPCCPGGHDDDADDRLSTCSSGFYQAALRKIKLDRQRRRLSSDGSTAGLTPSQVEARRAWQHYLHGNKQTVPGAGDLGVSRSRASTVSISADDDRPEDS